MKYLLRLSAILIITAMSCKGKPDIPTDPNHGKTKYEQNPEAFRKSAKYSTHPGVYNYTAELVQHLEKAEAYLNTAIQDFEDSSDKRKASKDLTDALYEIATIEQTIKGVQPATTKIATKDLEKLSSRIVIEKLDGYKSANQIFSNIVNQARLDIALQLISAYQDSDVDFPDQPTKEIKKTKGTATTDMSITMKNDMPHLIHAMQYIKSATKHFTGSHKLAANDLIEEMQTIIEDEQRNISTQESAIKDLELELAQFNLNYKKDFDHMNEIEVKMDKDQKAAHEKDLAILKAKIKQFGDEQVKFREKEAQEAGKK